MSPLAHGVGSDAGLPLPLDLVLQAGAATVVLSFLIAAFWWRTPRLKPSPPRESGRLAVLRYPVLLLALYITGLALAGPRGTTNPAAHALFVWLWVGLIPISIVFGPVWRAVNPLRTIFTLLGLPRHGLRPLAPGRPRSSWPAAAFLLVFVWFELVVPHHGDPVPVGLFLLLYGLSQVLLALLRGEEWFARGDCFEVYSELAGRLSPLRHRQPLSGLAPASRDPAPTSGGSALASAGLAGFVAVWWGSTVFDSASASPVWTGFVDRAGAPLFWGSAGLVLLCGLVFLGVRWTAGRLDVTLSLIPIAAGYTLAHYLSLLIVEAPRGFLLLLGQPAGRWDVSPSPAMVAGVQITLILIGHMLGVIVAHDRALAEAGPKPAMAVLADELPLVLLMIGFTWAGLFLLFVR
ncbi:hypothetical protein Ait01nite_087770 [Actinoplanes italicus]|uniref:Uncharacterized protein n=2 Tax=Actinoplanes italicus TaxID=113567 RepID=A0A2T0K4T9_9ACTN|nr:hypothetical protein [Actinoplanes italicus]PRX17726.1 hypothetical protein CLV67_115229 [Actinoplanes italicus]GIE35732.1 hypothetical protein Ait01nite_087770 [Actinoplanes italicus]